MKKVSVFVVVLCIVLIASQQASAQFLSGISELTAFIGKTFNSTDEITGGGALTFNVSPNLGVEGEVGMIFADDEVFNINMNLVLNVGSGTSLLIPYFVGGAGILTNGGTDIALNTGVGFKLFVEPNMALRVDFRGFFTTEDGDLHDMERLYAGLDILF